MPTATPVPTPCARPLATLRLPAPLRNALARTRRRGQAAMLALLAGLAGLAPQADAALLFAPFSGSGNALVFDAATGDGGWTGTVVQDPDPAVADPLNLVSVVLFHIDPLTRALSGSFSFTRSADLGATLTGLLSGTTADGDVFANGGQYAIDYTIQAGTGDFAGATGFGLSFLQVDPAGLPDNYTEAGLLVVSVPEPGTLTLLGGALAALAGVSARRRRRTERQQPA